MISIQSHEFLCHLGIITLIYCKMTVAHEIVLKSFSNPCDYLHSITKIQLSFNRKKSCEMKYIILFQQLLYTTYFACMFVALEWSSSSALFVFPCSNAAQCMLLWI